MAVVLYLQGYPLFDPRDALFDAVVGTTLSATTTNLTYRNPDTGNTAVFHGTFTLDGGGHVTSGTVVGFDIFADVTHLQSASGYSMSATALLAAIAGLPSFNYEPFNELLLTNVAQFGSADDDSISGFSGVILGRGGDDRLSQAYNGGDPVGFMVIRGGKGDDGISGGDSPIGSELYGGVGNDDIGGGQTSAIIYGGAGDDYLAASNSGLATTLIFGGSGDDILSDSFSTSSMHGGKGDDILLFHTFETDFVSGFNPRHDTIGLDIEFGDFEGVNAGVMTSGQFVKGTSATTLEQRIIYDPGTGNTFFDADGIGTTAPVLFAVLPAHLKLHADNFVGML